MLLHTANPIIPEYLRNVNGFAVEIFDFSIPLAIPPKFHYNTTPVRNRKKGIAQDYRSIRQIILEVAYAVFRRAVRDAQGRWHTQTRSLKHVLGVIQFQTLVVSAMADWSLMVYLANLRWSCLPLTSAGGPSTDGFLQQPTN